MQQPSGKSNERISCYEPDIGLDEIDTKMEQFPGPVFFAYGMPGTLFLAMHSPHYE